MHQKRDIRWKLAAREKVSSSVLPVHLVLWMVQRFQAMDYETQYLHSDIAREGMASQMQHSTAVLITLCEVDREQYNLVSAVY